MTSPTIDEKRCFADIFPDQDILTELAKAGIVHPTPVQVESIPLAMEGRDLIVQAQTGSGKTLAFLLPIIHRMRKRGRSRGTYALVLTPTRELANQVQQVLALIAPDIQPVLIIGGANQRGQEKQLKADDRIVVGTPGRVLDLINQRVLVLRACKTFVLDEADEMLSMGFIDEVRDILKKLPKERQGFFFSATMPYRVNALADQFLKNPSRVQIVVTEESKPQIEHFFVRCEGGVTSKANALCDLLSKQEVQSGIVFCNTKSDTETVEKFMQRKGFQIEKLNADLSQKERDRVMEKFRSGEIRFLVATDVAARGIDVKDLEMVVNYSIHDQAEVYVHRTGRTGRAGASGKAVSLIGPTDFVKFRDIKRELAIEPMEIGGTSLQNS